MPSSAHNVSEVVLGIDLGTTNCVMAVMQDGDVEVLQNDIGSRSTPSCVHVSKDPAEPSKDVGEAALRLAVSHPMGTVRNVMSILGRAYTDVKSEHLCSLPVIGSKECHGSAIRVENAVMVPEEVVSMLLVHLKKAAEEQVGGGEIKKAVIAVPAYFNAAQRQAVKDAAYIAGLKVQQLVNAPSAAALVYARDREQPRTVVVVDIGGGGSSVAVVRTQEGAVEVLAASGRRLPGGEDFDTCMVEFFKKGIQAEDGVPVAGARSLEIIRGQWEKAKQKLSRIPSTRISAFLPDGGRDFQVDVQRATFEEQCGALFQAILDELPRTLNRAQVAVNQVDDVVLVGGSSRIPRLRALVQEALAHRPLCKAVSADEAVAKGAALLGAGCVRLDDVTPLKMLLVTMGREVGVEPNCSLPQRRDVTHGTSLAVRQGFLEDVGNEVKSGLVTIFETKRNDAHQFIIDQSGYLKLLDAQGSPLSVTLRGCLSVDRLRQFRESALTQMKHEEVDLQRIKLKNDLEEKCRANLSREPEAAESNPDAGLIWNLRNECETQLYWLSENPNASFDELSDKLAAVEGRWFDLKDSRDFREAEKREAERKRDVERQREAERKRDVERQREAEKKREVERHRESERKRVARQREAETKREIEQREAARREEAEKKKGRNEREARQQEDEKHGKEAAARRVQGDGVRDAASAGETLTPAEAEQSLRSLYESVFRGEALRRKSFSLHSKGPQYAVQLRALADHLASRAVAVAADAGRAVLVVDAVPAAGRLLVALSLRHLDGGGVRRPVERLLALRNALATSSEDLLRRLDGLGALREPSVLRGVAWEDTPGPMAVLAPQLLQSLQARTGPGVTRAWSGSHCPHRRLAADCAARVPAVRDMLETADELQELFSDARLAVLLRACPAVTPPAWATLRGVVRALADPRTLAGVKKALVELRRLQALRPADLQRLLRATTSAMLHVTARILDAVLAAADGVAALLAFSGPPDLAAVPRCLDALRDVSAVAAAARGGDGVRLLRFESARRVHPLVVSVLAAAREGVMDAVRQSALPLWTRHVVAEQEDFLQDVEGLHQDQRRAVLGDLRRYRKRPGYARCWRGLLAVCCSDTLRTDFPALEDALQATAMAAAPAGPCCQHCHDDGRTAPPAGSLRRSVLGAGYCPEDVLEPTMILLSSTDWSAVNEHRVDVSAVVQSLVGLPLASHERT